MDPYQQDRERLSDEDKREEHRQQKIAKAYQEVFLGSESGRLVLNDLLSRTSVFTTTFTGNSKTFFLEGSRNVGLQILSMLEISRYEDLESIREDEDAEEAG